MIPADTAALLGIAFLAAFTGYKAVQARGARRKARAIRVPA